MMWETLVLAVDAAGDAAKGIPGSLEALMYIVGGGGLVKIIDGIVAWRRDKETSDATVETAEIQDNADFRRELWDRQDKLWAEVQKISAENIDLQRQIVNVQGEQVQLEARYNTLEAKYNALVLVIRTLQKDERLGGYVDELLARHAIEVPEEGLSVHGVLAPLPQAQSESDDS